MTRLIVMISLVFVGCSDDEPAAQNTAVDTDVDTHGGDSSDTAASADTNEADAGLGICPADPPWLSNTQPWSCDTPGLSCTWPALGCAAGTRPDNVCVCSTASPRTWRCDDPQFHNCLPIAAVPFGDATQRPEPVERAAPGCGALPPKGASCTAEIAPSGPDGCSSDADCPGDAARCVAEWSTGRTSCRCVTNECLTDADCGEGEACACGGDQGCGGPYRAACNNRCVPAECRTSANCGAGQVCSPSMDVCGWTVESLRCHDPAADECQSSWECAATYQCRWFDGQWGCDQPPMCD